MPLKKISNQQSVQFARFHAPSQQFGCTREVCRSHIFDVMHVPQGVLDYQDIAVFEIRIVHISKSAQQTTMLVRGRFMKFSWKTTNDAGLLSEV
jgi:hypothetical protein